MLAAVPRVATAAPLLVDRRSLFCRSFGEGKSSPEIGEIEPSCALVIVSNAKGAFPARFCVLSAIIGIHHQAC
jgi:hypothetical protein